MNLLIIAYNRPDIAEKLLAVLEAVKPPNIFLAFDGPRPSKAGDADKCQLVQSKFSNFSWECIVHRRVNPFNVGSNENILGSIDWFFTHVNEGIILEDDCIPDPTFFAFAQDLLKKYVDSPDIFMISGSNFLPTYGSGDSYRFTKLVNIWGWATWKRAWSQRLNDLALWPSHSQEHVLSCYGDESNRQWHLINDQYNGIKALKWGTLWRLTCLINCAINIMPSVNLVNNIGFGREDATNTTFGHPVAQIPVEKMFFPLTHPDKSPDRRLDEQALYWYYNNIAK